MDPITIGALIAGIATVASGIVNAVSTNETNKSNVNAAQKENKITREREDNAIQRAVADAKAAGLSPLSAIDMGPAQSSSGITANQIAPQMDLSSLTGLFSSWSSISETERHNKRTEKQEEEKLEQEYEMFNEQLDQQWDIFLTENETKNKEINQELNNFNKQIIENNEKLAKEQNHDSLEKLSEQSMNRFEKFSDTIGYQVPTVLCETPEEYKEAWTMFNEQWIKWLKENGSNLNPDIESESKGTSSSENYSGGVAGVSAGTGSTESKNESTSKDITRKNSAEIAKSLAENNIVMPIYIYVSETKK